MALVFALNNMLTQNKDYLGLSFDIENEALLYEKSRILCSKKLSQYFSVKNQGENNPFFGKQHTDETKLKISESKSGQHWTEEQKLNQSIRLTGRKMSDEACKNIALSKLGAKNGASKAVKCIELDLTFDTIGEACKYLGVSYSLMGKYLKTNYTDKNNNHWAYVDTSIEKQDLPNFYTNFYNSSPNISIIDTCKQFNIGKYKLKNIFKKYNVHIKNAIEVNTGRQKSDEVKKQVSERFKGKPKSEDQKRKIGLSNTGKSVPDNTRQKISKAVTGNILVNNGKERHYIKEAQLDEYFKNGYTRGKGNF